MSEKLKRIDEALGIHYSNCDIKGYYNENGEGKFIVFVRENGFDENDVDVQLGDETDPDECLYIGMDDNFPLILKYIYKDTKNANYSRNKEIYKIIKYCYKYGVPPQAVDFNIDHDVSSDCGGSLCQIKIRLLHALKYYQTLNLKTENDQNKLIQFYTETYQNLLQDFCHLIVTHSKELDDIYDFAVNDDFIGFGMCDVFHCRLVLRHNRDRRKDQTSTQVYKYDNINKDISQQKIKFSNISIVNDEKHHDIIELKNDIDNSDDESDEWCTFEDDPDYVSDHGSGIYDVNADENSNAQLHFQFICDLFDAIHCYLFHQYDLGYRIHKNDKQMQQDDDILGEDKHLKIISAIIREKQKVIDKIAGFKKSNKFNIDIISKTDNNTTYIDGLYEYMNNSNIDKMSEVKLLFEAEEYDSEAINSDIQNQMDDTDQNVSSNILKNLLKKCYCVAQQYYHDHKLAMHSFSLGFAFYYWDYYQSKTKSDEDEVSAFDVNDLGGYEPHELYVKAKYENIKQEILQNKIFCLTTDEFNVAMAKANKYIDVSLVKQMRSPSPDHLHFIIRPGTRLKISNLLSVFLYTDFSDLSKEFSKTFRKLQSYQSLSSVKIRNAEFAQWARILRETVEYYGQNGRSNYFDGKCERARIRTLKGPFYSGMQVIMAIPEFNIRLYGPTSTSRQIEVAERFKGDSGIIIQFNNVGERASMELFGLDCSWLSNYNGEDEVLFFGGLRRIKIETLIVARVGEVLNYKRFFNALYIFDCMIGGTSWANDHLPHIKKGDRDILDNLINHKLDEQDFKNNYDEYINRTFEAFCNNKTTIGINIPQISTLKMMKNLILDDTVKDKVMLKLEMLKIFKNVNHVIVYTTDSSGWHCFEVDIIHVVDELKNYVVNNFTITFKARQFDYHNLSQWQRMCTWLSTFCNSSKRNTDIGRQLHEKDWHIALETKKLKNEERKEDNVTISKIDRKNNMFLEEWNIRNGWKIGDHIEAYFGYDWYTTKITAIDGDRINIRRSSDTTNKAWRFSPDIRPHVYSSENLNLRFFK